MLIILLMLSALAGLYLGWCYLQERKKNKKLDQAFSDVWVELGKRDADYNALDQGFTEVTDAYATDMAQYESTIAENDLQIKELQQANVSKAANIMGLRLKNGRLTEENLGLSTSLTYLLQELHESRQAALDLQIIASTHDAVCLPTLG